jgi:hypothetical protein
MLELSWIFLFASSGHELYILASQKSKITYLLSNCEVEIGMKETKSSNPRNNFFSF